MNKKILCSNKKIYYDYDIISRIEVGIVLFGYEVKAIKHNNVSLNGSVVYIDKYTKEAFIDNMYIDSYKYNTNNILQYNNKKDNCNNRRIRKLLIHKFEIYKLLSQIKVKGLTLVPLEVYTTFCNKKIKLLICIARGKKLYNKKEKLKKNAQMKDLNREFKDFSSQI
jgi:SsrA-binding protein